MMLQFTPDTLIAVTAAAVVAIIVNGVCTLAKNRSKKPEVRRGKSR